MGFMNKPNIVLISCDELRTDILEYDLELQSPGIACAKDLARLRGKRTKHLLPQVLP